MCIGMHGAMSVRAECRRTFSYAEAMPDIAAAKIKQKIRTAKQFGVKNAVIRYGLCELCSYTRGVSATLLNIRLILQSEYIGKKRATSFLGYSPF